MRAAPLILVVEDDRLTCDYLTQLLTDEGYRVDCAMDGQTALERSQAGDLNLILLDRGLPKLDGLAVCEQVRTRASSPVPIIMLTAQIDLNQRMQGFAAGVDDYVTKPFSSGELVARIRAVLRRTVPAAAPPVSTWPIDERLQLDVHEQAVIVEGRRIELPRTQWSLLRLLVENAGQTVPFKTILTEVWGPQYTDAVHYIHLYVNYLRRQIEPDPSVPRYILSQRGVGYQFVAHADPAGASPHLSPPPVHSAVSSPTPTAP